MANRATAPTERTNTDEVDYIDGARNGDAFFDDDADNISMEDALARLESGDADDAEEDDQFEDEDLGEEDDVDEDDGEEEEPDDEEEPEEEEDDEPEQPAQPDAVLAAVRTAFPDLTFETPDDVVGELQRERQANDTILQVMQAYPQLTGVIGALSRGGDVDLADVLREHLGDMLTIPDEDEDPAGYREHIRTQGRREAEQKARQQRQAAVAQEVERFQQTAVASIEKLATDRKLDTKAAAEARQQIADFIDNPTDQFAEVIYRGLHFDRLAKEVADKAKVDGRNEAITDVKSKSRQKKGDGIARFADKSSAKAERRPSGQKQAQELAQQMRRSRDPLTEMLG